MGTGGRGALAILLGMVFAAAPAAASANTTFCVPTTAIAGCPAGSTGRANIANALFSVNNDVTSAHDTIRIGPGTYPEGGSLLTDMSGHRVDIVGAGAGQTVIRPSGSSGVTTLTVAEPSSTVRGLTIGTDAGAFAEGLELSGTATRVSVAAASAATESLGVVLDGGTLSQSTVAAHEGVGAIGGRITATRISGDFGVGIDEGTLTIDDSLITTTPGPASEEAISDIVSTTIPVPTTATLKLRHDTLIGDGSSGSSGVSCQAIGGSAAAACQTTIDSSVIRGFQHAIARHAMDSGAAASANVSIDYSDLDPSGNVGGNPGGGTGSIALGAHDLNVNPAFAATSGPLAFKLSSPSPVIDKGDPKLGAGEPTTDLAGAPRVLPGRRGARAVSDMGAFEYRPHPPTLTVAAVARPKRVARFTATTSDPDPGDVVTVRWHFDDGTSASGASVSHVFSKAGTHTATAKATDLDGYSAHASVSVTVGRPILSHPKLRPRKFKANGSTLVRYTDSQAATATLTVLHPVAGVRKGRLCAASRKGKGKHPKKCTRWVAFKGSFKHQDVAGANSFRFRDHKLRPGRYRLRVVATSALGASAPVEALFTIKRP